jgi:hypothetical protein
MKEIKSTILYGTVSVITVVIPFYYGSGSVIYYGSGSATLPGSGAFLPLVHIFESLITIFGVKYALILRQLAQFFFSTRSK